MKHERMALWPFVECAGNENFVVGEKYSMVVKGGGRSWVVALREEEGMLTERCYVLVIQPLISSRLKSQANGQ